MNKIENYATDIVLVKLNANIIVSYKECLTPANLRKEIAQLPNPQIVLWYFGSYGLSRTGVNFYRNQFLTKGVLNNNGLRFWLYDLRAWAVFDKPDKSLTDFDPNADRVNAFAIKQIRTLKSKDFFNDLISESNPAILDYLRNRVLEKKFLYKASEGKSVAKIKIGDIFRRQCPIFEGKYEMDTAKCYSAVQYIEGIYLIRKILETALIEGNGDEITIVFALPGDELKYYKDKENGQNPLADFTEDLNQIMGEYFRQRLNGKRINVKFYTFQYQGRPYNDNLRDVMSEILPEDLVKK